MKPKILVIDDEHSVRRLIGEILHFAGYDTVLVADGRAGIAAAKGQRPDVILCDVTMPGLDGYQTLTAIREDPETAFTPFIFLTGCGEREDIRQGMASGADDYITKPFSAAELIEAVRARLSRQAEMVKQNEQKLADLDGSIVHLLPHELRTPLQGIMGFADILVEEYATLDREEIGDLAKRLMKSSLRLHRVVENFLVYAQIQAYSRDPERLSGLRAQRCQLAQGTLETIVGELPGAATRRADIDLWLQEAEVMNSADDLRKIAVELLDNALKFSEPGSAVQVSGLAEGDDRYLLTIQDYGRGMTAEQIGSIGAYRQFDRKFYEQQGTGLGLIIAKQLTELHGGELFIDSAPGEYTKVEVRLLIAPPGV